jgi:hypothetical protein
MATNSLRALAGFLLLLGGCAGAPRIDQTGAPQPDPALICSADRGMGGTGISSGDDHGMGGTGILAQDRGMGGTGIIGTVTGFGSICVNGFRVAYGTSTPVSIDGVPVSADILARGMTVAATATVQGGTLQASSIEILHALVGPVTAKTATGLAVMGVAVETAYAAGTPAAALAVGDMVAVDGLQRENSIIDATHIIAVAANSQASVRGVAMNDTIGGVAIMASGTLPPSGVWAKAVGTWANGIFQAQQIVAGTELASAARLSIEGYLVAAPKGGFVIRGVTVQQDASRGLSGTVLERFAAGQRVQIFGQRQSDGSLRPDTVIVPERLSPLDTARTATATAETQAQRGVYGETVTRPQATREVTPMERPAAVTRPARPVRPEVRPEVRPDVRPEIPRPGRR